MLPVSAQHAEAAATLAGRLQDGGVRVELDDRDETLGKRIRDAELEKVPLVAVWGEKETDDAIAVRRRGAGQETLSLEALIDEIAAARR